MANIAYVDHSYHAKTGSTLFLVEILRRHGHTVDIFWDDSWQGKDGTNINSLLDYDIIIMFQVRCLPENEYYRIKHKNVISIPMLDTFAMYKGLIYQRTHFFEPLQGSKILSFSHGIHNIATSLGISSFYVKYFPDPSKTSLACFKSGLHAFFWIRHEDQVSWSIVRSLIGRTNFSSIHLHTPYDPGSPKPILPTADECRRHNITMTSWLKDKREFFRILERANIFFAPRSEEGIGQAFLEAMARGQCVVSQNHGTINKYIQHGLNGLLYEIHKISPLDFSHAEELGLTARKTVEVGYTYWKSQEEDLIKYILTPSDKIYNCMYIYPITHSLQYKKGKFNNSLTYIYGTGDKGMYYKIRYKLINISIIRLRTH